MALLFMDGFDHYVTADFTKKWTSGAGAVINVSNGRRGGGGLTNSTGSCIKILPASYSTLIFGCAFNRFNDSGPADVVAFGDATVVHCGLSINTNFGLDFWRGTSATVLGSSANGIIPADGYCYLEIKATINNSTGSVQVRLNGNSTPVISLTGIDTQNAGTAGATRILLSGNNQQYWDDLYICDTSGSAPNNDFLGDCRIDTLFPTSDGNYTAFTPSTGSSHFALVDETAPNTTDYNDGSAVNDRDSYGMGNLSALTVQTVYGVQVNAAILKDDAGAKSAAVFVRSGSTDSDGASRALSTSQAYVSEIFPQDPAAAAAWTEATVNALEAGVKVTA